jgi:hypothetical protein
MLDYLILEMILYNKDVITTSKDLLTHMPLHSNTSHVFLSLEKPRNKFDTRNKVWFKKNVNLNESTLCHFICDMVAVVILEGNFKES